MANPQVPMTRVRKVWLGVGVAAAALALLVTVLLSRIPSDAELARRAATALEGVLGVPVSVGALHWRILPSPQVVVENVVTRQPQPVTLKKLTVDLNQTALWQRRLQADRATVEGAVLPQLSLRGLGRPDGARPASAPSAQAAPAAPATPLKFGFTVDALPLAHIDFQDVTWISRFGTRLGFDGQADFDANWRLRSARIVRPGVTPAADLAMTRQGQEDRWEARINLGGGTVNGEIQLQSPQGGGLRVTGTLQPRGVELASALEAFNHRSIVAGRASGETSLQATGATPAELAQSLHTTTRFTVGRAELLRFDLDKAIHTLGKEHAGKTSLESISGQLDTQNTPQGMVVNFTRLKTGSGVFSASGQARVANRRIEAEFAVDLVEGIVGVPLKVSGPFDKIEVSVPASALAGAAVGTAVLPGIGTAIGARIGAALGRIFGSGPAGGKAPAPAKTSP